MQNWKRTFAFIWTGQFVSLISSTLVNFAIILWLSIETQSAEVLAYAAIAGLLPQSVLGLFTGVYVDKWNRKLTMILADGFIAVCTLAISLLLYIDEARLGFIYLLLAFRSVGSAFHMPALQASVPLIAPENQLLRIAGINQVIQSVSIIGGPALGALAIGLIDIEMILLIDVFGAAFAIITLLFVRIPNPKKKEAAETASTVIKDIKIGIQAITQYKGLKLLFVFFAVTMLCIMPVAVLFPLMTLQHFNGNAFQMSIIEVVWGVGMLVGGGILGIFKPSLNKAVLINITYIIIGLTFLLSGILSPAMFVFFVVLTSIGGIAAAACNACFTVIIQEKITPDMLGRVFSLFFSISLLPSIIGLLATGFLADSIGIPLTFVVLGALVMLVGLVSNLFPEIIEIGKTESNNNHSAD